MVKLERWRFSTCASAEGRVVQREQMRLVNTVNINVSDRRGERNVFYVALNCSRKGALSAGGRFCLTALLWSIFDLIVPPDGGLL